MGRINDFKHRESKGNEPTKGANTLVEELYQESNKNKPEITESHHTKRIKYVNVCLFRAKCAILIWQTLRYNCDEFDYSVNQKIEFEKNRAEESLARCDEQMEIL